MVGPETLNAVSPSFVIVRGMIKSVVAAERRRLRDGSRVSADWRDGVDDVAYAIPLSVIVLAVYCFTACSLHCAAKLSAQWRAKLSGAVYCNRTCLWVCGCVCLFLCLWVRYHDNPKLYASILTKLGL